MAAFYFVFLQLRTTALPPEWSSIGISAKRHKASDFANCISVSFLFFFQRSQSNVLSFRYGEFNEEDSRLFCTATMTRVFSWMAGRYQVGTALPFLTIHGKEFSTSKKRLIVHVISLVAENLHLRSKKRREKEENKQNVPIRCFVKFYVTNFISFSRFYHRHCILVIVKNCKSLIIFAVPGKTLNYF